MQSNATRIVSNRISKLYKEITYFSEDKSENIMNYKEGLNFSNKWLPILNFISKVEFVTNTDAHLETMYISSKFNDTYDFDSELNILDAVLVTFSDTNKVIKHYKKNQSNYSLINVEVLEDEKLKITIG